MAEYLDIVDENGQPTGEIIERSAAHREGIPHRTSHLWLVRELDNQIQILLQKRAMTKSFPGCYDISSAGHIPAGQDYIPSAVRELKEELGLSVDESELIFCGNLSIFWDDVFFGVPYHDRQYTKVFLLWKNVEENDFVLQEEEVSSVRWMDLEECVTAVMTGTLKNCIAIEELQMVQTTALKTLGSIHGHKSD